MMKFNKNDIKSKSIPADVIDIFFNFLDQSNTTTKKFYDVEGDVKILTREVEEIRPNDLKASLALFEKIYPQYFDALTIERLEKLRKESGSDDEDKFKKLAREMLAVPETEK